MFNMHGRLRRRPTGLIRGVRRYAASRALPPRPRRRAHCNVNGARFRLADGQPLRPHTEVAHHNTRERLLVGMTPRRSSAQESRSNAVKIPVKKNRNPQPLSEHECHEREGYPNSANFVRHLWRPLQAFARCRYASVMSGRFRCCVRGVSSTAMWTVSFITSVTPVISKFLSKFLTSFIPCFQ